MKHLYLLPVAALLLATSASAQSTKHPSGASAELVALKSMHRSVAGVTGLRGGGPANDECAGATNMTVNSSCQTIAGTLDGATQSIDPALCSGFSSSSANDVWFTFTATSASTTIDVTGGVGTTDPDTTGIDPVLEVFEGACSDLASMVCSDMTFPAGTVESLQVPTTAGTTYFYRIYYYAYGGPPTNFEFTTCVYSLSAPPNDDCAGAIAIPLGTFCNPVYYSASGATESLPALLCNGLTGNANDDIWFSFTATAADMTIGAIGAAGTGANNTIYDAVVEAFDACGGTSLGCADATVGAEAEALELTGLSVGNTYYYRVYHYFTPSAVPADVGVCVVEGAGISIGVGEEEVGQDWAVFPNPNNGDMTIRYGGLDSKVAIELFDVAGRAVYQEQRQLFNGQQVALGLSGTLANGMYTVRLTTAGGRSEQRVIVQ